MSSVLGKRKIQEIYTVRELNEYLSGHRAEINTLTGQIRRYVIDIDHQSFLNFQDLLRELNEI